MWDFGTRIVREAEVAGGRLAAIVGGSVQFYELPGVGLLQVDNGGPIRVVDLATASEQVIQGSWRQLALSPDGRRLVAVSGGDLWLVTVP